MGKWRREFPKCEVCGIELRGPRLSLYRRFCSLECKRLQVVVRVEDEQGKSFARVCRELAETCSVTDAACNLGVDPAYFGKLLKRHGLRELFPDCVRIGRVGMKRKDGLI